MQQSLHFAVVTGGNRGMGLEICRQLGQRGIKVMLTARDPEKAEAAAQSLRAEGLDVQARALDVLDAASIDALVHDLQEHYGRLDILVNNAGIFPDPVAWRGESGGSIFDARLETLRDAMETNTYAPLHLCQKLIPLMHGHGRVVNISSGMGQLSDMNGCCPGYRLSKTALNAVTRIFHDELQGTGVKINSVCPGWVRTDMGGREAERNVQEGAQGVVWLATLPDDGPSGGFFRDGQPIPW